MKSILISIHPKWCVPIANGKKTVEVRKTAPSEVPFRAYIYCTKAGRPFVYGDVFRGNWETEYTQTYGWSKANADRIWGVLNGKVIGEFICCGVDVICPDSFVVREDAEHALEGSCISVDEFKKYMKYIPGTPLHMLKDAYAWHISNLVIYDEPKELSEFFIKCDENCYGCSYFDDNEELPLCCSRKIGCKPLTRPPQSWRYVEPFEEGDTDE